MSLQHFFTCISCHVGFKNTELQREHYKSDWHRYNLKRKMSNLPPVSAEKFEQKVSSQKQSAEPIEENTSTYCVVCRKSFRNENAFNNHSNSKKHKENEKIQIDVGEAFEKSVSQKLESEEVDSDEWNDDSENPIEQNNCLFCFHHSQNFIKNLEHMTIHHSFFIPDIEYCTDVYGLLHYLGEKISNGLMCIWCNENGKTFHSTEAARNHMIDKGHCRMLYEGAALTEYVPFYDYSSSYPDAEHVDADEEVDINALDDSDYQLVLPSGSVVGHRSLMRYYKQSLNPNAITSVSNKSTNISKIITCYRSLGWIGTKKEDVIKKAKDIHHMIQMQAQFKLKMGLKGNKLQKNFKPQVQF